MKEINSPNNIYDNILKLKKSFEHDDKTEAMRNNLKFRRFYGFIQRFVVDEKELKIVLFSEENVRIFHDLAKRDIVCFDATGGIVKKIKGTKKIFLYVMVMRNPYNSTVALPVASYITGNHNTESISLMLLTQREKEKELFGDLCQPVTVIIDNSKVLRGAVLKELNGETFVEYLNIYLNKLKHNHLLRLSERFHYCFYEK